MGTFLCKHWHARLQIKTNILNFMLFSDIDEILEEISTSQQQNIASAKSCSLPNGSGESPVLSGAGNHLGDQDTVTLARAEYQALLNRLQVAETQVKQNEEQLQQVVEDMENMRYRKTYIVIFQEFCVS